jgi:hypothetical protein
MELIVLETRTANAQQQAINMRQRINLPQKYRGSRVKTI